MDVINCGHCNRPLFYPAKRCETCGAVLCEDCEDECNDEEEAHPFGCTCRKCWWREEDEKDENGTWMR